jgi:signal transduction histidine kinase
MLRRENRPYLFVSFIAAALIAATVATSVTTIRNLREIDRHQADSASWLVFQFEHELGRMRLALTEARLGRTDEEDLRLRWEILVSRLAPLKSGEVGAIFKEQPYFRENFAILSTRIDDIDRFLAANSGQFIPLLDRIEPMMAEMSPPAHALSIRTNEFWQDFVSGQRSALADRLRLALLGAVALLMLFIVSFVVLIRQRTHLRRTAQDLSRARFHAELANRAKTDFLAHMSHEFRTPMNAIIGFSDVMANETFGPVNNPRYKEYVGHIVAAGHHLLELINSVLDVAKIEAGKIETTPESIKLGELCPPVIDMIRTRAADKNLHIALALEAGLPAFSFDPRHLRQILINLLINAVKFTPVNGYIELGAKRTGPALEIWVRDTGTGIAPADLAKVMQPFGQIAGAQQAQGGTGLGLHISKALAELNGGKLLLESALDKGTTVTLSLANAFPAALPKDVAKP